MHWHTSFHRKATSTIIYFKMFIDLGHRKFLFLGLLCMLVIVISESMDSNEAQELQIRERFLENKHKQIRMSPLQEVRFCGRQLTNALYVVCGGNFQNYEKKSTSVDWYSGDSRDDPELSPSKLSRDVVITFPFMSRMSAESAIRGFRRQRRGIVEECCLQTCTYRELASYCSGPVPLG